MADLSVGYTAGLIALGIVIAQLWLPTAISFLLAGTLRDEETAASWTVAAKILQSSHWTTLLRTDSARHYAVRTPIFLASLAIPVATLLTAIAGVVTPLGLYEEIAIGGREVGNFSYVRDTSAFFDGTSPRGGFNFSRVCNYRGNYGPCPFTNDTLVWSMNSTTMVWRFPGGLHTDIPGVLRDMFSSGTRGIGTTVSNFFDIQWRQLTVKSDEDRNLNDGSPYSVSMFRQLDSVALEDSIRLVEGLVVDTRSGGIGFRNHTVPQPADRNVTWEEDLLFIEPVTACVNTNLTFDFTVTERNYSSNSSSSGPADYRITDRGGFVNLNRTYPYYDRDNPQANPDLWGRAYKAAMMHNAYTMMYLNVTNPGNNATGTKAFQYVNSTMGQSFLLDLSSLQNYKAARLSAKYGAHVFSKTYSSDKPRYPNPFNVTESGWFHDIRIICSGAGPGDIANITNIFVTCGLVTGPPKRVNGGPQSIFELGSKWSSPLYSCATAVRATIKTVQFSTDPGTTSSPATTTPDSTSVDPSHRGIASLLRVTNITAKSYRSPDSYPLWGVEDTGRLLRDITPIWGLLSPAYPAANFPNISYVQQLSLYLIGLGSDELTSNYFSPYADSGAGYQNLPGADFPFAAANTIYLGITDSSWPFDLLGRADMAVFTRWQALCATAEGAGKMINLLWTDLAASAVVGTKGISTASSNDEGGPAPVIHVRPTVRRTRYHFAYGIPAFVLLAALVALTVGAFCAWLSRMSSVERVRTRIQQLSAGRIFTIVLYPGESDFRMSPREWSLVSGSKTVRFGDGVGGDAGEGVVEEVRDVQTPGASSFADDGGYGKAEGEDMGTVIHMQHESHAEQHGGYIALDPVGYETRYAG